MPSRPFQTDPPALPAILLLLCALCVVLSSCDGGSSTSLAGSTRTPAPRQVLTFPNVGAQDIAYLDPAQQPAANDPAQGPDPNSALVADMLYSGLMRSDKDLNVISDQATWDISSDSRVYTFHLKPGIAFSDGTPITASTYVYTLTRALLPEVRSPVAAFLEQPIKGASDVSSGKKKTLSGVRALDDQTLQITLTGPTPYFLQVLTNPLFFPLNPHLIESYGQHDWVSHAVGSPIGSGPFFLKEWDHNVRMILAPNPHYYGAKTRLTEIDMVFVNDPSTAYKEYKAGQYDFVWNIQQADLQSAKAMPGYISVPLLQTDLVFFNTRVPPFDNPTVRQAFAYAIDKVSLTHALLKDSATPATTFLPPGMPGYQQDYQGIPYDKNKAKSLLLSVYPDASLVPPVTFSYPNAQFSLGEARLLRGMWLVALGNISIQLLPTETNAYNDEVASHQVQLGFAEWNADFPDPYNWLASNLLTNAPNNHAQWSNAAFDQLITQAEQSSGTARLALYNQAEQLAINDGAVLPLDHEALAAVFPSWMHGITLNGQGLYFGDWSQVYVSAH